MGRRDERRIPLSGPRGPLASGPPRSHPTRHPPRPRAGVGSVPCEECVRSGRARRPVREPGITRRVPAGPSVEPPRASSSARAATRAAPTGYREFDQFTCILRDILKSASTRVPRTTSPVVSIDAETRRARASCPPAGRADGRPMRRPHPRRTHPRRTHTEPDDVRRRSMPFADVARRSPSIDAETRRARASCPPAGRADGRPMRRPHPRRTHPRRTHTEPDDVRRRSMPFADVARRSPSIDAETRRARASGPSADRGHRWWTRRPPGLASPGTRPRLGGLRSGAAAQRSGGRRGAARKAPRPGPREGPGRGAWTWDVDQRW